MAWANTEKPIKLGDIGKMVEVTAYAVAEMCAQLGGFSCQSACPDQSHFYNGVANSD